MRVLGPCWIRLRCFFLTALILSATSFANDYYIAPTGSDSNNGTSSGTAWATFAHANSSFAMGPTGTVIHVANGTYPSGIDWTRGGTSPTVRLVIQCDNGIASATVAIGKCMITGSSAGFSVEANNVDVVGFDIGNNINMPIAIVGVCDQSGSICTNANSMHVIGNYVHDLASNVTGNGILGCPDNGAVQIGSNQHGYTATDPQAIRNFVKNFGVNPRPAGCNTAQGLYFGATPPGSYAVAYDNIVVKIPVAGIISGANCNLTYSNNTVISTYAGIIISRLDACAAAGHNTFNNNAIFNSSYASVANVSGTSGIECSSGAGALFADNISDGGVTDFSPARVSCDTLIGATTTNFNTHQAGSSFFVNYQADGTGDYHLKPGSAGIGAGATACVSGGVSPCAPTAAFEGTSRPSPPSVGAFEVAQSASNSPIGLTASVH